MTKRVSGPTLTTTVDAVLAYFDSDDEEFEANLTNDLKALEAAARADERAKVLAGVAECIRRCEGDVDFLIYLIKPLESPKPDGSAP